MDASNLKFMLQQLFEEYHAGKIDWKEFEQRLNVLKELREFIGDPLFDSKEFKVPPSPNEEHEVAVPEKPSESTGTGFPGGRGSRRSPDEEESQFDSFMAEGRRHQTKNLFQIQPPSPKTGTGAYLSPKPANHPQAPSRPQHPEGEPVGNEHWPYPSDSSPGSRFIDATGSAITHRTTGPHGTGTRDSRWNNESQQGTMQPGFDEQQPSQYPYVPQARYYPPRRFPVKNFLLVCLALIMISFLGGIFLAKFDKSGKWVGKSIQAAKKAFVSGTSSQVSGEGGTVQNSNADNRLPTTETNGEDPVSEIVHPDNGDPHMEDLEREPGTAADVYPFVLPYELPRVLQMAAKGDVMSQRQLGEAYFYGKVLPIDNQEAARYFGLAAAQGDPLSIYHLGRCYELGLGVEQNMNSALENYRIGSQKGDINSQVRLGYLNEKGINGPPNLDDAVYWYTKAEKRGSKKALKALERIEKIKKTAHSPKKP